MTEHEKLIEAYNGAIKVLENVNRTILSAAGVSGNTDPKKFVMDKFKETLGDNVDLDSILNRRN